MSTAWWARCCQGEGTLFTLSTAGCLVYWGASTTQGQGEGTFFMVNTAVRVREPCSQ